MAMIKYGVSKKDLPVEKCPKCGKIKKLYLDKKDKNYCNCSERKDYG